MAVGGAHGIQLAPIHRHHHRTGLLGLGGQALQALVGIAIGDEQIKVVSTPGHSKGSICLLGDGFMVTGDTIFAEGFGWVDTKHRNLPNRDVIVATRKRKHDHLALLPFAMETPSP